MVPPLYQVFVREGGRYRKLLQTKLPSKPSKPTTTVQKLVLMPGHSISLAMDITATPPSKNYLRELTIGPQ